jgi:hypothetical protein
MKRLIPKPSSIVSCLAGSIVFLAAAREGHAQSEFFARSGTGNELFGVSMDQAGDYDDDGRPDLIIGASGKNNAGLPGFVEIVSPATGAVLRRWDGTTPNEQFGFTVANVGDYDGDGEDDFAVGSEHFLPPSNLPGRLRVFSGATGAELVDLSGSTYGAKSFGTSVDGLGDLDGDGKTELLVGAWSTLGDGRVLVLSSIDSHAIYTYDAANPEDGLGFVVRSVGDIDGDSVNDFAMSAPQFHFSPGPGYVIVCSGATGAQLHYFEGTGGPGGKDFFGQSMEPAGDIDGDGIGDLIVGSTPGTEAGYVRVFSLATGALLHEWTNGISGDGFGGFVAGIGDVEGDGVPDLAIVTNSTRTVGVYSGQTWAKLYDFVPTGIGLGGFMELDALGDVDLDGFADFALAHNALAAGLQPGRVSVHGGYDFPVETYCTAKVNSKGCTPAVSFTGVPSASQTSGFVIRATDELSNKQGSFFYSHAGQQAVPFLGGTLCVKLPIKRTGIVTSGGNPPPVDCSGVYALDFNAYRTTSTDPLLIAGATIQGQFWSRDSGFAPPNNSNLSDAIRFTIAP